VIDIWQFDKIILWLIELKKIHQNWKEDT